MDMNILKPKLDEFLDGWTIIKIGMIDRYRYLVMANWSDEKKPYIAQNGKKYKHPTRLYCIDLSDDTVWWSASLEGFAHGYCDGGIIRGNKEAFFGSYNGVTYHLDYDADKFEHEELLLTDERIKDGTARGINAIKLIGDHFYTAENGNEIYRRDAPKQWTLISEEAVEYSNKFGNSGVSSIDGFSENEIYFSGQEGNLWYYDGKYWEKIFGIPEEINFEYVLCSDDGKVYAVDSHGRGVAVGRGKDFSFIPMKKEDPANGGISFAATHYKGKIYLARYGMYEFRGDHWVKADIPGVYGGVEHLSSKDGMLFIGTPYSLKIYNGKETFTLYGEAKEDAKLITKALIETSTDFLQKGHALLDEIDEQRKE